jgi:DNA-binding HxlR family transcriptional regulator
MTQRMVRCPVANTLDLVGDRWTLLVVRDLLRGRKRFSELRGTVEGIPPGVLSGRLKSLEREGIVVKRWYTQHPPRAEYLLTRKGHALGVVVGALATWGEAYGEHDLSLVDGQCGHHIQPEYHCPTCDKAVPRNRARIVSVS